VGAYRDNEVSDTHPLALALQTVRNRGAIITDLELLPLGKAHITSLIQDTFKDGV
jgi:predicted ATPase